MNTKENMNIKNTPEEYFQGKDLVMANAISSGDEKEIENLIKSKNYNVNTRGNSIRKGRVQRTTYLGYAIKVENFKSTEKLLQLGADVVLVSFDGESTGGAWSNINLASTRKNEQLMNLLLTYKVNLNNALVESPLSSLLINNANKTLFELLLKNGVNLNHQNYIDGSTPLLTALSIGKFDYVNYFLDHGADPLLLDSSGNSVAYLVQKEIEEGRLNDQGLKEYKQLLNRLKDEKQIQFPLKRNNRRALEQSIARYENLSTKEKEIVGATELERIEKYRTALEKGVDLIGRPLD